MADEQKKSPPALDSTDGKKPYVKPTVTSEPIHETLALACGKLSGQGGTCRGAPHRS